MAKNKDNKKIASVKDYQILLAPVVTEKTSSVGEGGRRVTFRVDPRATKLDIKKAVEAIFGVNVESVNTANYIGKKKRVTGKMGVQSQFKKAHITLVPGQVIDVVEGL